MFFVFLYTNLPREGGRNIRDCEPPTSEAATATSVFTLATPRPHRGTRPLTTVTTPARETNSASAFTPWGPREPRLQACGGSTRKWVNPLRVEVKRGECRSLGRWRMMRANCARHKRERHVQFTSPPP